MISYTAQLFFYSFAVFGALQLALLKFFLYWRYPWIDVPMHFFGGIIVGLGVFAARDLHVPFFARLTTVGRALMVVLAVVILWEVLEYVGGITAMQDNFVRDTALDLALGLIGGVIGIMIGRNLEKR